MKYILLAILIFISFACTTNEPITGGITVPNSAKGKITVAQGYTIDKLYLEESVDAVVALGKSYTNTETKTNFIVVDSTLIIKGEFEFAYELKLDKKYRVFTTGVIDSVVIKYYYEVIDNRVIINNLNFPEDFTKELLAGFVQNIDSGTNIPDTNSFPLIDSTKLDTAANVVVALSQKKFVSGGATQIQFSERDTDWFDVSVTDFYMDSTVVTVNEFFKYYDTTVVKDYPAVSNANENTPITDVTWFQAVYYCNEKSKALGLDTLYSYDSIYYLAPYNDLAFDNIRTNFDKIGIRLPTLAEWTRASEGGVATKYFWGVDSLEYQDYAWVPENSTKVKNGMCEDVAQKLPNQFGLYDLVGNGLEFCNDFDSNNEFDLYYGLKSGKTVDPTGSLVQLGETLSMITTVGNFLVSAQRISHYREVLSHVRVTAQAKLSFRTVIKEK